MISFSKLTVALLVVCLCASTAFGMKENPRSISSSSSAQVTKESIDLLDRLAKNPDIRITNDGSVYMRPNFYLRDSQIDFTLVATSAHYRPGLGLLQPALSTSISPAMNYLRDTANSIAPVLCAALLFCYVLHGQNARSN